MNSALNLVADVSSVGELNRLFTEFFPQGYFSDRSLTPTSGPSHKEPGPRTKPGSWMASKQLLGFVGGNQSAVAMGIGSRLAGAQFALFAWSCSAGGTADGKGFFDAEFSLHDRADDASTASEILCNVDHFC